MQQSQRDNKLKLVDLFIHIKNIKWIYLLECKMARRVGGVGCGPLDDDCGAGFVVKRVDVNRWMSESDLSFLGTELCAGGD